MFETLNMNVVISPMRKKERNRRTNRGRNKKGRNGMTADKVGVHPRPGREEAKKKEEEGRKTDHENRSSCATTSDEWVVSAVRTG